MLSKWLRGQTRGVVSALAATAAGVGLVSPNLFTVIGFVLMLVIAVLLAQGSFLRAAVFIALAGVFDALDGGVARHTGRVTRFGAFLDSTLDRFAEAALYGGLLWWYTEIGARRELMLVYATVIGSLMVSYTRARAEGIGLECNVGLFTRFERVVVLVLGLLLNQMTIALTVLAIFSNFTALQRMWHVYKATEGALGSPHS